MSFSVRLVYVLVVLVLASTIGLISGFVQDLVVRLVESVTKHAALHSPKDLGWGLVQLSATVWQSIGGTIIACLLFLLPKNFVAYRWFLAISCVVCCVAVVLFANVCLHRTITLIVSTWLGCLVAYYTVYLSRPPMEKLVVRNTDRPTV